MNQDAATNQGEHQRHAKTRELENQTLKDVAQALRISKIAVLQDCAVGTARLLPSGDWRLVTAAPREAEVLKTYTQEWVGVFGSNATIAGSMFGVIIDGIRKSSVDMSLPKTTVEQLKTQNHRLLQNREIKRIRWLQKPRPNKFFASMVIDFALATDANAAIAAGELFWFNETRAVRRFVKSCQLNQCYKCHKYGHRSTQCRNPIARGFCSGVHPTVDCPNQGTPEKAKCTNCKGPHTAWSPECKIRSTEKTKAKERIRRAPIYWNEPTQITNINPGPSVTGASQTSSNSNSNSDLEPSIPKPATSETSSQTLATVTPPNMQIFTGIPGVAGVKRPLAERSTTKPKSTAARKIRPVAVKKGTAKPVQQDEENENESTDNSSEPLRSGRAYKLRKQPKQSAKQANNTRFNILEDDLEL